MEGKRIYNSKTIGWTAILINFCMICIELLVLLKVVPYDIIGGGRMESYGKAASLAIFSILTLAILMYCIAVACNILVNRRFRKIALIVLRVFTVYFTINIVMNLMGKTWFERIVASLICIVQITCFVLIIRAQRTAPKEVEEGE